MTESEWLTCADPEPMLAFLRGRAGARKLRLFAVACSRRAWHLLDGPGRAAVEVAERFADGDASGEELRAARLACKTAGTQASWYAAASDAGIAAGNASRSARSAAGTRLAEECAAQARLLRDVFGNPFRPVVLRPAWLTAEVVALAGRVYEDRGFDRMPALADALARAGCDNPEVLGHCREGAEHARGCWVLDLLLGKG
jgi:hypothetical protein